MRTYDFSPLSRSTIGFDRLFDLIETAQRATDDSYPPYNIERLAEDRYQITLAVAGFSPNEISITAEQNVVIIEGGKAEQADREFLYRGISTRQFKRQFSLADYVQAKSAAFDNGLLKIELVREIPEAMKPRRIAIDGAPASNIYQRRPNSSTSGVSRVARRAASEFVYDVKARNARAQLRQCNLTQLLGLLPISFVRLPRFQCAPLYRLSLAGYVGPKRPQKRCVSAVRLRGRHSRQAPDQRTHGSHWNNEGSSPRSFTFPTWFRRRVRQKKAPHFRGTFFLLPAQPRAGTRGS
jgi:molecular chaperone IbpA